MPTASASPIASLEPRLRTLLPADLYVAAWVDPSPETLKRVFDHLRTLLRILHDYVPRPVAERPPVPGAIDFDRQAGTLMFTDLAGFTPLMEANAARGRAGAISLLEVLNAYFSEMLEIISKSGGNLLEFTGDAMLVVFPKSARGDDAAQAMRAGLRMQRAMGRFANLDTEQGPLSLGMRLGVHAGEFLAADIGTPRRMNRVLLGSAVTRTKQAEAAGQAGRVNLTEAACERVRDEFRTEPGSPGHWLLVDDLTEEQLGEYEVPASTRRQASMVLMDRSVEALAAEIEKAVTQVEPLVSYLPSSVVNVLVENAAQRAIQPDFPNVTACFVNLIGLAEKVDEAAPEDIVGLVSAFSRAFALINAAAEARGGVLKNVTYHLTGSDMMIFFGAPTAHTDDALRAADAALAIRDIVMSLTPPSVGGKPLELSCQIGMASGPVFAAEIGERRGRREFNILGDTVNTAARLMGRAIGNRILVTEGVHQAVSARFDCLSMGPTRLKGKAQLIPVFALKGRLNSDESEAGK
jgi:class 3 adenylate cyclase